MDSSTYTDMNIESKDNVHPIYNENLPYTQQMEQYFRWRKIDPTVDLLILVV